MSRIHFDELTILHIDVVHRSGVLLQQHTKFATWCEHIRNVGAPVRTLSFMTECVIRGGRVVRILNSLRIRGETPDMHWLQGHKIIFKMHEYISQQQEMMHQATLLHMSPERQVDISVYNHENVKARTAEFLLESSVSVLNSVKQKIQERLVELHAINANIFEPSTTYADEAMMQSRIDRMESLTASCDSALAKTHSLYSLIHVDSAGDSSISKEDWKVVKNDTKFVSFDIISWMYSPAYLRDVLSNIIINR